MKPTITVEIRGPQGCGKTQLFNHLFNLLRANPFEPRGIETPVIELRTTSGDKAILEPSANPKPYAYGYAVGMNSLDTYADAGSKAGLAAKRKDMSTVTHWQSWCNRAVALEPDNRKSACREAFRNAYREESALR